MLLRLRGAAKGEVVLRDGDCCGVVMREGILKGRQADFIRSDDLYGAIGGSLCVSQQDFLSVVAPSSELEGRALGKCGA